MELELRRGELEVPVGEELEQGTEEGTGEGRRDAGQGRERPEQGKGSLRAGARAREMEVEHG